MPFELGSAFIVVSPTLADTFAPSLADAVGDALGGPILDKISERGKSFGKALTKAITAPVAAGTTATILEFRGLDAKIRETITLFGEGGERARRSWDELIEGTRGLSREVGILEGGISDGLYQAISAGVPRPHVFDFLETASKTAIGGALDTLLAVDGLTTAVNAFESQALTADRAADIMFRGVARGKTTFAELSSDMARAAPLAEAAGISFEQFIAAIVTMTLAGTKTSEAFALMKAGLTGILRPSEDMSRIWEQAGFQSGEAAIAALGYAGAMDAVVQATDGQAGALIGLLGGAEAANAALQVGGDNLERYNSVLIDVTNSTGAMESAFETMQGSASRTFGQLFAGFGRIGSRLGKISFDVVEPLVRFATDATNAFERFISSIPDGLLQVGKAFVFLGAVMGPLIYITSALIGSSGLGLLGLVAVLRRIGPFGILRVVVGGFAALLATLTQMIPILQPVTQGLLGVVRWGLGPLGLAAGAAAFKVGLIVAAVAGGLWVWHRWRQEMRETEDRINFATTGVERLAESLNLVTKPLQELKPLETVSFNFVAQNQVLLERVEELQERGVEGEDILVQIAFRLHQLGNTPEDIRKAIEQVADVAGIEIPVNFTFSAIDFRESVVEQARILAGELGTGLELDERSLGRRLFDFSVDQTPFLTTQGLIKEQRQEIDLLAEQVTSLFQSNDVEAAVKLWRELEGVFGDNRAAVNAFNDAVLVTLADTVEGGVDLDWSRVIRDDVTTMSEAMEMLQSEILGVRLLLRADPGTIRDSWVHTLPDPLATAGDEFANLEVRLGQVGLAMDDVATHGIQRWNEEWQRSIQIQEEVEAAGLSLEQTIRQQAEAIQATYDQIEAGLTRQIPLFGQYEGAAKLKFGEVTASLDKFTEDLGRWTELSDTAFSELPESLRTHLDEASLAEKAWLADLAESDPAQFAQLLEKYETAFAGVEEATRAAFEEELPGILADAETAIVEQAEGFAANFGEEGANAAASWLAEFRRIAPQWEFWTGYYARQALGAARRAFEASSPSRAMARLADDVAAGYVLRLRRHVGPARAATAELALRPTRRADSPATAATGAAAQISPSPGVGGVSIGQVTVQGYDLLDPHRARVAARHARRGLERLVEEKL